MDEDLEKAKKLFFGYCCNRYFMARDAADREFDSYGVTEEQQAEWRSEYIANWTARLSMDDFEPLSMLSFAGATEPLPDLIAICDRAESYAKLKYADVIWQLSKSSSLEPGLLRQAQEACIQAWQSLTEGNFIIPEHHQKKINGIMPAIQRTTPQEYVINEARKQLEEAKKSLS